MKIALRTTAVLLTMVAGILAWDQNLTRAEGPTTPPAQTQPAAGTPKVGQKAPDFTLQSLADKSVQLSKLTAQTSVVLVVLRGWPGYQCPLCTRQVGEFIAHAKELPEGKVQVVLVYPGPSEQLLAHAQEFVGGKSIPANFTFVLDPDYQFTNRYALRWNAPKETAYPSTFVIDRAGVIRFVKSSKTHGDRAEVKEVVRALGEIK